jgi:hypothetical protein
MGQGFWGLVDWESFQQAAVSGSGEEKERRLWKTALLDWESLQQPAVGRRGVEE